MDKFIIYKTSGGTYGEQLRPDDKEEAVKKWIEDNGGVVLRPNAIVGKDEADAIARYHKASGLRKEASDIQEAGKRQMTANEANARMNAEMQGGIYGDKPSFGQYVVQLLKAPQTALTAGIESVPEIISNPSDALDIVGNKFKSIYEKPTTVEKIATDPTWLIPGTQEIKVIKNAPTAVKALRYAIRPLKDAAIQTGASTAIDLANTGETSPEDIGSRLGIGTIAGIAGKGIGEAMTAGGKKILSSKIKNKIGAENQSNIDELMAVTHPDYQGDITGKMTKSKYVIRPFTDINQIDKDVNDAILEYAKLETQNIGKHPYSEFLPNEPQSAFETGTNLAAYDEKLRAGIEGVKADLKNRLRDREINRDMYDKAMSIVNIEESRLHGFPTPDVKGSPATPFEINNARKDFGKRARYDISDLSTSDPTSRETYRSLHDMARESLIWAEGHKVNMENPYYADLYNKYSKLLYNLKNLDPDKDKLAYDTVLAELDMIGKRLTAMNTASSKYAEYAPQMTPLMAAREPIEKAIDRSENAFPLPLTMLVGAGAGGAGTQSLSGLVGGAVVPILTNSVRTGTTLYRAGEPASKVGRYAIPIYNSSND